MSNISYVRYLFAVVGGMSVLFNIGGCVPMNSVEAALALVPFSQ